jgi:hypothetical protein
MPVREIVNSLYLTYMGTEWMLVEDTPTTHSSPWHSFTKLLQVKRNMIFTSLTIFINLESFIHPYITNSTMETLWHVRIGLAAVCYVVALYFDCKRSQPSLTLVEFLLQVSIAFCRVLPVYPFLAVLVSFVFLFVISLFEHLHLPVEVLNWPIYYGTLYGPFSWIYWQVKKQVIDSTESLPTRMPADIEAYYAR